MQLGLLLMSWEGDPWYNASVHGNNEFLNEGVFVTSKALSGIEFRANNIESLDNLETVSYTHLTLPTICSV